MPAYADLNPRGRLAPRVGRRRAGAHAGDRAAARPARGAARRRPAAAPPRHAPARHLEPARVRLRELGPPPARELRLHRRGDGPLRPRRDPGGALGPARAGAAPGPARAALELPRLRRHRGQGRQPRAARVPLRHDQGALPRHRGRARAAAGHQGRRRRPRPAGRAHAADGDLPGRLDEVRPRHRPHPLRRGQRRAAGARGRDPRGRAVPAGPHRGPGRADPQPDPARRLQHLHRRRRHHARADRGRRLRRSRGLQSLPGTNVARDKKYDQIAFRSAGGHFQATGRAGAFDFYEHVFTADDADVYRPYIDAYIDARRRAGEDDPEAAGQRRRRAPPVQRCGGPTRCPTTCRCGRSSGSTSRTSTCAKACPIARRTAVYSRAVAVRDERREQEEKHRAAPLRRSRAAPPRAARALRPRHAARPRQRRRRRAGSRASPSRPRRRSRRTTRRASRATRAFADIFAGTKTLKRGSRGL